MNAPRSLAAPIEHAAVFDAAADALDLARTYSAAAVQFAEIRDARGLAYACRCAAASLETAAGLVVELRPSRQGGQTA